MIAKTNKNLNLDETCTLGQLLKVAEDQRKMSNKEMNKGNEEMMRYYAEGEFFTRALIMELFNEDVIETVNNDTNSKFDWRI